MAERMTDFAGVVPSRGTYPIAANTKIEKGKIVCLDSSGRAIEGTTLSGGATVAVGKASSTVNNLTGSDLGGSAEAADQEVEFGVFGWKNSSSTDEIANDDAGKVAYVVDDETVALTSGSSARTPAGIISEVRNSKVYVWMSPAVAKLAAAMALADAGITLQKRSVTVGHADLTDADTSQTINIGATLPANARIVGASIHTCTAFSGGSVSALVVDIGTSGDVDAIVDGADLMSTVQDGQAASRPLGIAPNKLFAAAGAQLIATFTSTTDNLVNLTAGTCTIDVLFSVLP